MNIIKENQELKRQENENKRKDRYNHFPFVSGELIEKYRAHLGA